MQTGYGLSLNTKQEVSVATRAELLAARIEEGAASLADFAEALSEKEWRTPVGTNGRDKRPIGVIVHHVASVYPIEVDLAKAIASGNAITNVTWDQEQPRSGGSGAQVYG
jgi:hypothetical protein